MFKRPWSASTVRGTSILGSSLGRLVSPSLLKLRNDDGGEIPDEDRFTISGGDLLESRVDFRIQMILCDDENDTHLVVDHYYQSSDEGMYKPKVHVLVLHSTILPNAYN
jgi:hypothetical protein